MVFKLNQEERDEIVRVRCWETPGKGLSSLGKGVLKLLG